MAQERTDEELLAAYQQGDPGAFEALLRRHRAPLFTFLLRMLGERERAEDLAQETFLRIVKGAQAWEHRARFQTWLFTIARNLCVDQARRDRFRCPGGRSIPAAARRAPCYARCCRERCFRYRPSSARCSSCASRPACLSGRSPRWSA